MASFPSCSSGRCASGASIDQNASSLSIRGFWHDFFYTLLQQALTLSARTMDQTSGRPLLSLCMIVKNEAEHLETCLRLARPHVDEIVIIDTGSTDGTQDIARRYADVFEEIEWPNSFAIARNYSLERASGTYILVLDGDEYIPDPRHWTLLRQALTNQKPVAARICVHNVLPPSEVIAADVLWQERVFLNHPSIRYEGKVHNQIIKSILNFINTEIDKILDLNVDVVHIGYAHNRKKIKSKYIKRLELLKNEFEEASDDIGKAYFGYQLALLYYILEEYEKSISILDVIDYNVLFKANPQNAFYALFIGSQVLLKLKKPEKALVYCNNMFKITKQEPIAYFVTGVALIMQKQIENGLLMLIESFRVNNMTHYKRFPLNVQALKSALINAFKHIGLHEWAHQLEYKAINSNEQIKEVEVWLEKIKTGIILKERQRMIA